jgi:dCMP deaminase
MNWDTYFYNLCNAVSKNSKCLSRNLGAVITRDKYIISTGYNGPPSGGSHCSDPKYREWLFHKANAEGIAPLSMKWNRMSYESILTDNQCPRIHMGYKSGEGLKYCQAAHAERNAIYTAARLGHSVEGSTIYLNWIIPCFECCKAIINSGITEVVVTELKDYEQIGIIGRNLLEEANIKLREYNFK